MSADDARSMRDQLSDIAAYVDAGQRYDASREAGEFGEAAAGEYISELADGHIVAQHNPGDAPQGIDTAFLDADGELHAGETKTIGYGNWHQPQTSRTADGRQMDQSWVADRLGDIDIDASPDDVGVDPGEVHRDLFQVDVPGDTFAVYSVAHDGSRSDDSRTRSGPWRTSSQQRTGKLPTLNSTSSQENSGRRAEVLAPEETPRLAGLTGRLIPD